MKTPTIIPNCQEGLDHRKQVVEIIDGGGGALGNWESLATHCQRHGQLWWLAARIEGGQHLGRISAREARVSQHREAKGKERKSSIPRLIKTNNTLLFYTDS